MPDEKLKEMIASSRVASDINFKSIFINEVNILLKMVSDITGIKDILNADFTMAGYEVEPYRINGKVGRSDMLIKVGKEYYINIEVNLTESKHILKRNQLQLFRICAQVEESGSDYQNLKLVGQLNLNNFRNGNGKTLARAVLIDQYDDTEIEDFFIKIWNLDIAKCYEKVYNNLDQIKKLSKAERWGAIIYANIKDTDFIAKVLGDDLITMEEKERITARIVDLGDPGRIITEDMEIKNNRLRVEGEIEFAREKGLKEGLEKGLEKGREQGLSEGLEQGIKQNTKEIIISMLKEKASYEFISKITGKTLDEIKKIEEEAFN